MSSGSGRSPKYPGKRVRLVFLLVAVLGVVWSPLPAMAEEPLRVMPLGDSITEGSKGDATYRYFLWHDLLTAGYSIDFVGSMNGVKKGQPLYPDFDQNHEGHSGWTAKKIVGYANLFAQQADPDVILLHAGTNDIRKGMTTSKIRLSLQRIIEQVRLANPEVVVFIAEVIPIQGMEAQVLDLNAAVRSLAIEMTTASSPVLAVDQNTGFSTGDLKGDGVHPTQSGFEKMADRWFAALSAYLGGAA